MTGSGGAKISLNANPAVLKRWMIAGPEQARILDEFEEMNNLSEVVSRVTSKVMPLKVASCAIWSYDHKVE